jgi:hypothetical protein
MAKKTRKKFSPHRLLIYYRIGQRLRTTPLFIALVGLFLLALGWMGDRQIIQGGNRSLLNAMWSGRTFLILMIVVSAMLYILMIVIARTSYVQVRPKALRVRAGLLPLDISYGRIRNRRLITMGTYFPPEELKGGEYGLLEPLLEHTCTVVDLKSWPLSYSLLKMLWSKYLFAGKEGLIFAVDDPMVLNQEMDGAISQRLTRRKGGGRYVDPIERAARLEQQSKERRR